MKFDDSVDSHIQTIHTSAMVNVNLKLNKDILQKLEKNVNNLKLKKERKLETMIGISFIPKIVKKVRTKIALKTIKNNPTGI